MQVKGVESKKQKILIIDDELMLRTTVSDFLEDSGYSVSTASNGEDGINKLKTEQFNAVLLDLKMPVVDGFHVLEFMRMNHPEIPVIVASGTGIIHEVVEAQRKGAWDYIIKPIYDMELLIQLITRATEKARLLTDNTRYKKFLEDEVKKRTEALEKINEKLKREIVKRKTSEERIRDNNMELKAAMEELEATNDSLLSSRKELEISEKKYRILADNVTDNIWVLNYETLKISYMSPSIEKLSGFSVDDMTGQSLDKIFSMESYNQIINTLKGQVAKNKKNVPIKPVTLELQMVHRKGHYVWVEITASFLRDRKRNINGILGISRDISRRKEAEEQIKFSLREKETLLKEIHHRVKNNMQVISSLLNLQSNYIDNIKHREIFIDCERKVHSMALIHEKLYQSEKLSDINIKELISSLSHELMSAFSISTAAIGIRLDILGVFLGIDIAIPLALLINELITNSLKYAFPDERKGGISISFKKKNRAYILSYSDDGIGMEKNIDYKRPKSMGLELIKLLTEQLDGTYRLERKNGTSYIFKFHDEKGQKPRITGKNKNKKIPGKEGLKKILIVEDDLITATYIKRIIESENYHVTGIADTSDRAIHLIRSETPDLILMDIMLKGDTDGIDTVRLIKASIDIPVIYSSANTDPLIRSRANETSPSGYVTKPINRAALINLIKKTVGA